MNAKSTSDHIDRSGSFLLPMSFAESFLLFTAEGERRWVDGWEPDYLYPPVPSNEAGTVFRTTHAGEETFWLVIEFAPSEGSVAYGRFTPGSRLGSVHVRCDEVSPGETQVTVRYALTAISDDGRHVLAAMTEEAYSNMLGKWREAILSAVSSSENAASVD